MTVKGKCHRRRLRRRWEQQVRKGVTQKEGWKHMRRNWEGSCGKAGVDGAGEAWLLKWECLRRKEKKMN
jgi:hypothetical protein